MSDTKLTTFYFVRHGQTDWNKKELIQGHTDIPLNEQGEEDAKNAALQLKHINFDLAFSSDLLRAKRTAEIIALEDKLTIQTTELLRERNLGELQGESFSAAKTHYKLLQTLNDKERIKYKITKNVESDEEMITRLITFIRETAIAYPGKTILVGTHEGILRMILIHLGEIDYYGSDTMVIRNGGYIKVESDGVDFFVKEKVGLQEKPYETAYL